MKSKRTAIILIVVLMAIVSNYTATAEVSDAFTPAWTDFKAKNQDLFNVRSPIIPGQASDKSMNGGDPFLLAQNQATETEESATDSEESSAFSSTEETARQSSNPLGGQFMILLNQV